MVNQLSEAINSENWELLKTLIQSNADININELLIEAIEIGILDLVTILLEFGANPNQDCGMPLILAVTNNKPDILKALIRFGGNPNSDFDLDGDTLLMQAVYEENFEIVKILVEAGAYTKAKNKRNKHDDTVLDIAASSGMTEIFNYLAERATDAELKRAKKILLKVSQLEKEFFFAIQSNDIQTVQKIVDSGFNVNKVSGLGLPLVNASHYDCTEILKILIMAGADTNLTSKEIINTPLIESISERNLATFYILLKNKANPNLPSTDGILTPLIAATISSAPLNNSYMIDKLLEFGAEVNHKNVFKNSAFMAGLYSCMENKIDLSTSKVIKKLVDAGAIEEGINEMNLILNIQKGDTQGVKDLLKRGVNVNMANFSGSTALINALYDIEIVHLLLDAGADVNMNTTMTPLMAAVNGIPFSRDKEVICLLIDSGANIDARNIYGQNIMDIIKEKPNDIRKILKNFFNQLKKLKT